MLEDFMMKLLKEYNIRNQNQVIQKLVEVKVNPLKKQYNRFKKIKLLILFKMNKRIKLNNSVKKSMKIKNLIEIK